MFKHGDRVIEIDEHTVISWIANGFSLTGTIVGKEHVPALERRSEHGSKDTVYVKFDSHPTISVAYTTEIALTPSQELANEIKDV